MSRRATNVRFRGNSGHRTDSSVGRLYCGLNKVCCEMTRIASPVIKRSIVRDGHKSSVSLEDEFWDALREIADRENMTMSALVATIDHGADNLSSAIRVFVLDHFRRSSEHTPASRPNQTPPPQGQPHLKRP